jgi:hypothetical protein
MALRTETVRALETSKLAQAAGGLPLSCGPWCETMSRVLSCLGACSTQNFC